MGTSRIVRVNSLLKREIAEDIQRIFIQSDFDCAAVTVTRVECSPDLHDANVYVSIFGHERDRKGMVAYLNRHRQEVVRLMARRIRLKYTPRLHFMLDESIEGGDRVLAILAEMEREHPESFIDATEKKDAPEKNDEPKS